jgi:hypothetical protein
MAKIMTCETYLGLTFDNEDRFTADTNMFISHNYESLRGYYFHIPNESFTNNVYRMKLYAMGVLPGAPDFEFLKPYTWFIELKLPGKTLTPAQEEFHKRMESIKIPVYTAWYPIDVYSLLFNIMGEPKYNCKL